MIHEQDQWIEATLTNLFGYQPKEDITSYLCTVI